ncbi:MAG: hypothetical protein JJW01_02230 [Alphaproteobacteria bacterium]|nr:hypothetical protein [Rickettsiales bacterium]
MTTSITKEVSDKVMIVALSGIPIEEKVVQLNKIFIESSLVLENEESLKKLFVYNDAENGMLQSRRSLFKNLKLFAVTKDLRYFLNLAEDLYLVNFYMAEFSNNNPLIEIKSCVLSIKNGCAVMHLKRADNGEIVEGVYIASASKFDVLGLFCRLYSFTGATWESLLEKNRSYMVSESQIGKPVLLADRYNPDMPEGSYFIVNKVYRLCSANGRTKIWTAENDILNT